MELKTVTETATSPFPIEITAAEGRDHSDSQWNEQLNSALEEYKKNYAEFIDIAIHDLHAPVRKLSVLVDKLVTHRDDNSYDDLKSNELVTKINGCISDLKSLIEGLSELADVTKESLNFEACDTSKILNETLYDFGPAINEKKIIVTQSRLPVIEGDIGQLRKLFKHLLQNATRFTNKNVTPTIDILSSRLNDEEKGSLGLTSSKNFYKIEIIDNGIGVKSEFREKIFEPFIRLNGKSAYAGNGLGLAVCKKIIDNHQGKLYAESHGETGSRFVLVLPETSN